MRQTKLFANLGWGGGVRSVSPEVMCGQPFGTLKSWQLVTSPHPGLYGLVHLKPPIPSSTVVFCCYLPNGYLVLASSMLAQLPLLFRLSRTLTKQQW